MLQLEKCKNVQLEKSESHFLGKEAWGSLGLELSVLPNRPAVSAKLRVGSDRLFI